MSLKKDFIPLVFLHTLVPNPSRLFSRGSTATEVLSQCQGRVCVQQSMINDQWKEILRAVMLLYSMIVGQLTEELNK